MLISLQGSTVPFVFRGLETLTLVFILPFTDCRQLCPVKKLFLLVEKNLLNMGSDYSICY